MISRKYFLVQSSLMALFLTGTLCASSTSTMLAPEAYDEGSALRISQAVSGQEPDENAPRLIHFPFELLKMIAAKADKESWNQLNLTYKSLNESCMDPDVLLSRGSTFVIQSADDLKEISERFYKNAPYHVPITFKNYSPTNKDLQYLKNATHVDLSRCYQITDEGIAHLTNATHVNLSDCTGVTNKGLKHLTNATHMNLSWCKWVTNEGLAHLTNATHVDLSWCAWVTNEGLAHLKNATHVDLSHTEVTNKGLAHLKNATHVGLSFTEVTNKGLAHLKNATHVNLYGTGVTNEGLANLTNATHVDLRRCTGVTNEGLAHLKNATQVNLSDTGVTKEEKEALRQRGVIVTG